MFVLVMSFVMLGTSYFLLSLFVLNFLNVSHLTENSIEKLRNRVEIQVKFVKFINLFNKVLSLVLIGYILKKIIVSLGTVYISSYHFIAFGILIWNWFNTFNISKALKRIEKLM